MTTPVWKGRLVGKILPPPRTFTHLQSMDRSLRHSLDRNVIGKDYTVLRGSQPSDQPYVAALDQADVNIGQYQKHDMRYICSYREARRTDMSSV